MSGNRARSLDFDPLERRIALNADGSVGAAAKMHEPSTYFAHLSLVPPAPMSQTTPTPADHASGNVKIQFSADGTEATVSGGLSKISNVSAIVLRLPPTATTTTAADGTSTTSMNDQTVAILVNPGAGSGAFRHVTFVVGINRFSLIGQLVGKPLSALRKQVHMGNVSVVVQTESGVDTGTAPGNLPMGEIQGTLLPPKHKGTSGQS
jgi:hypothetical protein